MKTRFSFSLSGKPGEQKAVLNTVGAVIGYQFTQTQEGLGVVVADNTNFWFMKGILERLESRGLISGIAWELDNSPESGEAQDANGV